MATKIKKSYTDKEGRKWRLVGFYGNGCPIYQAITTKQEREYIRNQKGLYKTIGFRAGS